MEAQAAHTAGNPPWVALLARARLRSIPALLGSVALVVSLSGITWVSYPAQPALKTPALALTFGGLQTMTSSHAPAFQGAFFGWLALVLVALSIVCGVGAALAGGSSPARRSLYTGAGTLALAGLLCTVFGLKGSQTWSQVWQSIPDMRTGTYLVLIGFLLLLIHAVAGAVSPAPARAPALAVPYGT
jgi:hypothetical protein